MNILLINGSPKGERSNTLRLSNAFLEGLCHVQTKTPPEIARLNISEMDIRSCLGCFSCWKATPGKCCIKDDMQIILDRLLWADLTIWSFPLYYYSVPGKLKMVIDRQLPLLLPFMNAETTSGGHPSRYDMTGKKTVLISTCGFYTAQSNYDSVTAQFDKMCGKGNYTTIFCGEGELFRVPELSSRTNEYLDIVRQAGQEYALGSITEKTSSKLNELLFPRDVFERMADASWGITPSGEKEDDSLIFTKQMAALYNPAAYGGKDIILDMDYTDIQKRYRIILGNTGSRVIDLAVEDIAAKDFSSKDLSEKPTTIIHTPLHVWQSIAAGEIEGSAALMKHLYSVEGDFNLMLKWDDYFGGHERTNTSENGETISNINEQSTSSPRSKTNMSIMLIPWIVFWAAAGIHAFYGSLISILVCCVLPLIFYSSKKTIYDVLSGAAVSIFSVLLLVGLPVTAVMPLSYMAFGAMWSITIFFKTPLSAEYSMNNYGGEKAFKNPMFMQTNRILTAAWGILYLLTAIWTYFIMKTAAASYIGLINSIVPFFMGIFTAWFQKWYPRKIARG